MGQINMQGALIGGPPAGSETFPASVFSAPLRLRTDPKGFNAATGVLQQQIATAVGVYAALPAIGTGGVVTKGNTFYFKSNGPVLLRLTTDDGVGGNVVAVLPINGLHIVEFDDTKFLKLAEVSGSALIEYFASGQA